MCLTLFDKEPYINRDLKCFVGMLLFFNNDHYKCVRIRESGINTFTKCDKEGVILPPIKNLLGNITDYGVRLIKFK